jgi:hypothetical protein
MELLPIVPHQLPVEAKGTGLLLNYLFRRSDFKTKQTDFAHSVEIRQTDPNRQRPAGGDLVNNQCAFDEIDYGRFSPKTKNQSPTF